MKFSNIGSGINKDCNTIASEHLVGSAHIYIGPCNTYIPMYSSDVDMCPMHIISYQLISCFSYSFHVLHILQFWLTNFNMFRIHSGDTWCKNLIHVNHIWSQTIHHECRTFWFLSSFLLKSNMPTKILLHRIWMRV